MRKKKGKEEQRINGVGGRLSKGRLRPSCLHCVMKHLGQAVVLSHEAATHRLHRWIADAHLAEAEVESMEEYPLLAERIRSVRLDEGGESEGLLDLIELVDGMLEA